MKPSMPLLTLSLVALGFTGFFIAARAWLPALAAAGCALLLADVAAREAVHERKEARREGA